MIFTPEKKQYIMERIAETIVGKAKRLAPIDTGNLRSHIYSRVEGTKITIYTEGVPYASFLEYGTKHIKIGTKESPRRLWNGTYLPFLRPAIYQTTPLIPAIVKEILTA